MLTCKEFDEFMLEYLEGSLPTLRQMACWIHLKLCRNCDEYVKQYVRTIAAGKAAFKRPDDELPDSVPDELVNAALARLQRK